MLVVAIVFGIFGSIASPVSFVFRMPWGISCSFLSLVFTGSACFGSPVFIFLGHFVHEFVQLGHFVHDFAAFFATLG